MGGSLGVVGEEEDKEDGGREANRRLTTASRAQARPRMLLAVAPVVKVLPGQAHVLLAVAPSSWLVVVLDMPKLRSLADRWGAWIHVDGGKFTEYLGGLVTWCIDGCLAFGIFARALPKTDEFLSLHANVAGLELADSIAADGHKLLNVVCYPLSCHQPICTVHATNTPLSPTTTASSSAATPPSSPRSAPTPTPPTSPPHLLLLPPETPSSPHSTSALKTRAASAPCPSTPCS